MKRETQYGKTDRHTDLPSGNVSNQGAWNEENSVDIWDHVRRRRISMTKSISTSKKQSISDFYIEKKSLVNMN